MNTKKKYLNIPMVESLYNRNYCKELALKIIDDEKITGMSKMQLSVEIFAHAYIYYNFPLIPAILRKMRAFKSVYRSVEDGVDLEDNGDSLVRRIAYRVIWCLPKILRVATA